jgi:hypothetical protein
MTNMQDPRVPGCLPGWESRQTGCRTPARPPEHCIFTSLALITQVHAFFERCSNHLNMLDLRMPAAGVNMQGAAS